MMAEIRTEDDLNTALQAINFATAANPDDAAPATDQVDETTAADPGGESTAAENPAVEAPAAGPGDEATAVEAPAADPGDEATNESHLANEMDEELSSTINQMELESEGTLMELDITNLLHGTADEEPDDGDKENCYDTP